MKDEPNISNSPPQVQRPGATSPVADLSLAHYELHIVPSGISDLVAQQRGYKTLLDPAEARRLGFSEEQAAHVPALLIPLHDWAGDIAGYQLRPNTPLQQSAGKIAKYLHKPGAKNVLDVPRTLRGYLADPFAPLVITEGSKKIDALASALGKGKTTKVAGISLSGVANWRGLNPHRGRGVPLVDWHYVPLSGKGKDGAEFSRTVYIAFDSDVMTKDAVHAELATLTEFLAGRGASVQVIYLPPGPNGAKVGLDDYLAAPGRTLADLFALAEKGLRPLATRQAWLSFAELLTLPALPWLIKDLLTADGVSVIYGDRGAYKSFVVLDWLSCIAGRVTDWFGLPVVKHGPAVLLYGEGRAGLGQRAQSLTHARRLPTDTPLAVWPTARDLADPESVEQLIAEIGEALGGKPPAIIAIDTLARNMPGRDENKQIDMNAVILGCDRLRTAFDCQVLLVHHTNRDGAIRGSTVLTGAADTLIAVERQADRETRLTVTKQKDADHGAPRLVRLRPEGSSLVVASVDADAASMPQPKGKKDPLLDHPKKMLVFRALAIASPRVLGHAEWWASTGVSKGTFEEARAAILDREFAVQDPETKAYRLAGRGIELAMRNGWIKPPV